MSAINFANYQTIALVVTIVPMHVGVLTNNLSAANAAGSEKYRFCKLNGSIFVLSTMNTLLILKTLVDCVATFSICKFLLARRRRRTTYPEFFHRDLFFEFEEFSSMLRENLFSNHSILRVAEVLKILKLEIINGKSFARQSSNRNGQKTLPCAHFHLVKNSFSEIMRKIFGRLARKFSARQICSAEPHHSESSHECLIVGMQSLWWWCVPVSSHGARAFKMREEEQMQLSSSEGWFSTNIINVASRAPEVC